MSLRHRVGFVLSLVVGLAAHAAPARAQVDGVVRGQVVTAADGSALTEAPVTLTPAGGGARIEARSDAAGRFSFSRVTPGEYVLSVSSKGFRTSDTRVVVEPRAIRDLTVRLTLGPVEASVDVPADRPVPETRSPSSTLLTASKIDAMPAAQRSNLPDAIVMLAPGMIRGHDDFVHIRGHEVALNPTIDGVSFWENPHALFSTGLTPEVIDTASVMTGGFPAEYGNRFGGVVDIFTKSGFGARERGTLSVSGGDAGRRSVSGELGGRRNRLGYFTYGSYFGSDRFLSPPDREAIHDRGRGARTFVRLDHTLADADALRFIIAIDGVNFEIPQTPQDVELRPAAAASQRTRQQTAIVGWTHAWSNGFLSVSGYQRWSRSRLLPGTGPLAALSSVNRELLTIGGKADASRSMGRHTIKAGVDLVHLHPTEDLSYNYDGYRVLAHQLGLPHIHVTGQVINFTGRASGGQASLYAQDAIRIGDRVTADVGLRVDYYDLVSSAAHASPRANVAMDVGRGAVLHASYNRFFVPPPVEGVLSSSAGLTERIREIGVGLPALEPTVEDQVEVGLSTPLRPFRFAVTGYSRWTDNPVHTTVWTDSRIYSYASFDRARAYGLEVKAETPGLARYGIGTYLNYALGRVYFWNPVTGGFVMEAEHLTETNRFPGPMDQRHTLTGGLSYTHARSGLTAGATVEYGSGTPIGHGGAAHDHGDGEDHEHAASGAGDRVPAHTTANLSLGIGLMRDGNRRPRLSIQIDVENVTNRPYLIAQEGEFSPTQFSVPRLVSLTARWRF
jgi:hypothetical protein